MAELLNICFFALGIYARSIIRIRSISDVTEIFVTFVLAILLALATLKIDFFDISNLDNIIFLALFYVPFAYLMISFNKYLPRLYEPFLLMFALATLYSLYINFTEWNIWQSSLIVMLVPMSIFIIIYSFLSFALPNSLKIFVYAWFFLVNIYFGFMLINVNNISHINNLSLFFSTNFINYWDIFIFGTNAFFIIVNFAYIYTIFSFDPKSSFLQNKKNWEFHSKQLINKHSDLQIHPLLSLLIIFSFLAFIYFQTYVYKSSYKEVLPVLLLVGQVLSTNMRKEEGKINI